MYIRTTFMNVLTINNHPTFELLNEYVIKHHEVISKLGWKLLNQVDVGMLELNMVMITFNAVK